MSAHKNLLLKGLLFLGGGAFLLRRGCCFCRCGGNLGYKEHLGIVAVYSGILFIIEVIGSLFDVILEIILLHCVENACAVCLALEIILCGISAVSLVNKIEHCRIALAYLNGDCLVVAELLERVLDLVACRNALKLLCVVNSGTVGKLVLLGVCAYNVVKGLAAVDIADVAFKLACVLGDLIFA